MEHLRKLADVTDRNGSVGRVNSVRNAMKRLSAAMEAGNANTLRVRLQNWSESHSCA